MKVDSGIIGQGLAGVPARVRALEAEGYDGAISAEVSSDPFLPLALAAEHSERIELITSIAVAFARNPMTLAQVAHDLNAFSKGRLILGLGSQIQAHITKRFSMPWSKPAARMRELVLAMRAIWAAWYEGAPLRFEGEFYRHTLMTPMFVPPERQYGAPRVFLAAVGPRMAEVAGEVADGLIAHAFTTPRYLREVTIPALERGLAAAGRKREGFEVTCPIFVVSGRNEEEQRKSDLATRRQIAFYGSTPAYRGVLELAGRSGLQEELNRLSKRGQWDAMGELIDDALLAEFAIVAKPEEIPKRLAERFGGVIQRVMATFDLPDRAQRAEAIAHLHRA
jgi:probable F420-dependent oxidoreductase